MAGVENVGWEVDTGVAAFFEIRSQQCNFSLGWTPSLARQMRPNYKNRHALRDLHDARQPICSNRLRHA
jgi:hypothetical protein